MYEIDMHVHSNLSDGDDEVKEICNKAKELGLKGLVFVEHNLAYDTEKIKSWLNGLETTIGIEMWTDFKKENVHILGYCFNPQELRFKEVLEKENNKINLIAKQILYDFKGLGLPSFEELIEGKKILRRGVIAREISEKLKIPYRKTRRMLGKYKVDRISSYNACSLIREAGGVSILAHPGKYSIKIVQEIIPLVDGIEAISPHNTQDYFELALKNDLIITGGSDYHGRRGGLGLFGVCLEYFENLKNESECIRTKKKRLDYQKI